MPTTEVAEDGELALGPTPQLKFPDDPVEFPPEYPLSAHAGPTESPTARAADPSRLSATLVLRTPLSLHEAAHPYAARADPKNQRQWRTGPKVPVQLSASCTEVHCK